MLIFFKVFDDFLQNNQDAAILKIIEALKNCHGRFTSNYPKRSLFQVIQFKDEFDTILHPPFENLRDLSHVLPCN